MKFESGLVLKSSDRYCTGKILLDLNELRGAVPSLTLSVFVTFLAKKEPLQDSRQSQLACLA